MKSINPYTEELIEEFEDFSYDTVIFEIKKTKAAQGKWKNLDLKERLTLISKVGEVLRKNKQKYAEIITKEMGKPIKDSLAEVEKCAWLTDYYFENSQEFLKDKEIETEAKKSYIRYEPLGILFAIMPWNYPFWQAFRAAIPALVVGNAVVLKHASNVPGSALAIEEVFIEAGLPEGVFKTLLIGAKSAMKIIEDDLVDAVTLTGSNKAGSAVGGLAGKQIKPVVLELGGSDPFVVLEDADVKRAAKMGATSRMVNMGQSCIAAKRFIVHESIEEEFTKELIDNIKSLKIGDPMDMDTDVGPIAKKEFVGDLDNQLQDAIGKGGKAEIHEIKQENGYFFYPCVVSNVSEGMKVVDEEVFGPIAPVMTFKDDDEAVKLANQTEFGLGGAVWSKDISRAEKIAHRINTGYVAINDFTKSDPRLPFGGTKKSGVGRELSEVGLKEFVNIKTIVINEG